MSSTLPAIATLADLARVEGKAELIRGRVVPLMPTGYHPGRVGGRIFRSLDDYAQRAGRGVALPYNVGFTVPELSSGRESFSPDEAYFGGALPADEMDFIDGPPTLAVEVRSKGDYGNAAEEAMAAKRADYFEAGTVVVWDVDPLAGRIRVYQNSAPKDAVEFGPGQLANAEPAVPGWVFAVNEILSTS